MFQVEMGEWEIGRTDAYEVTIPGTRGARRCGNVRDMGNPHVVAVIEDAFASRQWLNHWTWSPNQWWLGHRIRPERGIRASRRHRPGNTGLGEATMRVQRTCCGETLSCGTGLCATGVVLRAKTTSATGTSPYVAVLPRGRHRQRRKADRRAATLVADIDLL